MALKELTEWLETAEEHEQLPCSTDVYKPKMVTVTELKRVVRLLLAIDRETS